MISSERSQNIIIAITIIAAVVSSGFLVNNSSYYTASYELVGQMSVDIVKTEVSSIDPTNDSIIPRIVFTVNLQTTSQTNGSVRVNFIGIEATLNNDLLSYTQFAKIVPEAAQSLHPNYDRNFTIRGSPGADWKGIFDRRYFFFGCAAECNLGY